MPSARDSVLRGFAPLPAHRHSDYTTRYRLRAGADDMMVDTHGNGVSVVSLAPTHPIRRKQLQVESVLWQSSHPKSSQKDRSATSVTGKRKKGAYVLEPNSILCQVRCVDGSNFDLRATVSGRLLETNDRLRMHPDLLRTESQWGGYLAVFALSAAHRPLLSLGDRELEGSEEERDVPEGLQVRAGPLGQTDAVADPASAPSADAAAAASADAAAPAPDSSSAAAAAASESGGSELGAEWRNALEYLSPREYLERRKEYFIMPEAPEQR